MDQMILILAIQKNIKARVSCIDRLKTLSHSWISFIKPFFLYAPIEYRPEKIDTRKKMWSLNDEMV